MMAIEMAPKAPPAKASSSTAADGAGKSGNAAHAGSKAGQSFLSILGLVDGQDASAVDTGGMESGDPSAGLLPGMMEGDTLGAADDALQPVSAGPDPAALLAQLQLTPVQPPMPPSEGGVVPSSASAKPASSRPGELRLEAGFGLDKGGPKLAPPTAKSGKAILDAAANAANADSGGSPATSHGQTAEGKFALPETLVKAVREVAATLVKAPEISTVALAGNRERVQEAQASHKLPVGDVVVGVPTGAGGAMGVDGVVATTTAAAVDGQFAEQVNYWVGGDIQKAELTLDGFGADPVEVSISMQGNEAHVMFRTDEVQTRDALANASVELKQSLDRQGVVLSGVSVGTSNAGNQPQQQAGGKSAGWKTTKVDAAAPELKVSSRPGTAASSRSIDLFV